MADYGSRLGQAFSGAGSGAATGSVFGPWGTAIGGVLGGVSGLLKKSPEEERKESIENFLKILRESKERMLGRLGEETKSALGKIGRFTTGLVQRGQADIARRAASRGRTADEGDFLALQGQVGEQGARAISSALESSERARRGIEDWAEQQALAIERGEIEAPQDRGILGAIESIAPAAMQYMMNKEYLSKAYPEGMATMPQDSTMQGKNMAMAVPGLIDTTKLQFETPNIGLYNAEQQNTGDLWRQALRRQYQRSPVGFYSQRQRPTLFSQQRY